MKKNTADILSIKVKPSDQKAKNQDEFFDKVKALGFHPGAYKFYYKEQNAKNDLDMLLEQQKNNHIFHNLLYNGNLNDIEKIQFYLQNDPKLHLYKPKSPELIVNCKN